MTQTPLMQLFELQCVIENINIRLCCRIESGVKQLLALVTHEGDIILHYTYGELPSVIKRLAWFSDNGKEVQAVCFDPTATWLLAVCLDGSLHIIPALSLVDKKQKIDCKWSLNDLTTFSKPANVSDSHPLSVIWWQTLDCNQNALVGFDDGVIGLISLTDGRCLATCLVGEAVTKLFLCQDNSLECVSLLINGQSGQQWRLILEQHSTGYIWPPEVNVPNDNTTSSRLQSLKQMGAEKFASLKQKFSEARGNRRDSQTSDTTSESSHSESHSGLQLLPHLCDTFFSPQYARNRYLFSAFYKPTSLLTVHGVDIESAPLYVHKLLPNITSLLLTSRLIFAMSDNRSILHVISTQLSECPLEGDTEFNEESLLATFNFTKEDETILSIYRHSDISAFHDGKVREHVRKNSEANKSHGAIKLSENLKIRKPKIDTCVIITTKAVYSVKLSVSPLVKFITLVTEENNMESAEKLAIVFGLNMHDLYESCGDLLISNGAYHQGLILYNQVKVHLLKRVLKLATLGDSRALLKFIHLCLGGASKVDMSAATKIHMGNLAVLAYTELVLRHVGPQRITFTNDFMSFLRYEEFYDQILAVNVACQAGHWDVVNLLATTRGLQPEIVAALSQMLTANLPPNSQNYDFLLALSEPTLTQSLLIYPNYGQIILNYIRTHINYFPTEILQRFALQLDPSRPSALPIITRIQNRKGRISSSLDSSTAESEADLLDQQTTIAGEFLETFIWILTQLLRKTNNIELFNIHLLENIERPEREEETLNIKTLPPIHPLSCGFEHAAVVRNGNVYTMGMASSGCLGYGPMLTQSSPPKLVKTLAELRLKVLSVTCGRKHCFALTDYGLYAWGSNNYGQLGLGAQVQDSPYPQIVSNLCNTKIIDVIAGQYHSLALSISGQVYTWGWGVHGQLGHGVCSNEYYPKLLKFDEVVVQIAAGHAHSLILTDQGKVYGFGSNVFGQLETSNLEGTKTTTPVWVMVVPDIYTPIRKIDTSYFHNIAVRIDEEVYIWGASPQEVRILQSRTNQQMNGARMRMPEQWRSSVHIFTGKNKGVIEQVAVGFRHSALLHAGKLMVGTNMHDEMITPKMKEQDNMGMISTRFTHVSCGPDCTLALDHSGKLLAWGNSTMAQTLLGKSSQVDDTGRAETKVVVFKNTKRVVKISQNNQISSELKPIEVPGLPTMAITFSPPDYKSLLSKKLVPNAVLSIENDLSNSTKNRKYEQKTLHYVLETYNNFYDTEAVLARCLEINDLQAASKIAILNGHFGDSLGFQLLAFKKHVDSLELDFATVSKNVINMEKLVCDSNKCDSKYILHSNSCDKVNYSAYMSASASLDSIKQWSDDYEDQGGLESPCDLSEVGDIRQSITNYVQSLKNENLSPISSVSELIESSGKSKVWSYETLQQIKDARTRTVLELAAQIIEFYIMKTHTSENHILMQNILLKCIDFWLSNNFPVPVLESILLKNMDKYFYPLSILLFCKNFTSNVEGDVQKEERVKQEKSSGFFKEFSTKFCLQLCSMVLENVTKT